ncbi:hypothetical protein [Effusibacillus lacus]|uniref:hypothetical protein n=1 Tax=Effusibacillus lacus TaxID=1348429 RepID=UPI00104CFA45|nr:hypothetical protein [Effusibacillus lacus]
MGIELDQKYIKQVRQSEEARLRNRRERKLRMVNDMEDDSSIDSTFCFIAGHTENGFPYGTTWEEEKRNREKLADQRERDSLGEKLDDLVKGTNETKCSFNFTDIRNGSVYSRPYH